MRNTIRVALFLAVALHAAAAGPSGPARYRDAIGSSAMKHVEAKPLSPTVDLIVRFREPVRGVASMSVDAVATRHTNLAARLEDFRRDLERFQAGETADRPILGHTYFRVLYGAGIRVRRELRARIAALPYVASVQEARTFNTLSFDGVRRINADKVWEQRGTRGAGVTVAIIDTGIDYNHPALGGGFGVGFKVAGGWDFYDGDGDPMDLQGHGTHVAGIIAADGAGLIGVAPAVTLIAYRVLSPSGSGSEDDVIAAIERAVDPDEDGLTDDHVDVVNMSIGAVATDNDPVADAVENATSAGVLFAIAAGNSGRFGEISTPGIAPSAITVGASDSDEGIASFSSRGPSFEYGIKPEVAAPGVGILSSILDGKTAELNGTSMATPHVAGVAALVKSLHHDWTPAQIKAAILNTTAPIGDEAMSTGSGRIDALGAATVTTLASPAIVSFGQDGAAAEVWSASRTVTLRNHSTAAQTLVASVRGQRAGVVVRATPSTVTLTPGESATVAIDIAVTNRDVPAADEGSLSFGGAVDWSGGTVPIHVPWAFVKGGFLTIDVFDNTREVFARIIGAKRRAGTHDFYERTRLLWPQEPVDVAVLELSYPVRIVVKEQADLRADPRVIARFDDARYTITADTTDDTGQPLGAGGRSCEEQIILDFPGHAKVAWAQYDEARVQFNELSERIRIFLQHSCADTSTSSMYAAIHTPWRGLHGNVTSTLRPRWLHQDVDFVPAIDGAMTAAAPLMRFPGPDSTYYLDSGSFFLMRETAPHLRIFFPPSPDPEVDLVSVVDRWGRCYDPSSDAASGYQIDCVVVGDLFLYLNEQRARAEGDIFVTPSPMAYDVPLGAPIRMGATPPWGRVGVSIGPGLWVAGATWSGPLGEYRPPDSSLAIASLYDANGALLGSGHGSVYKYETLPIGAYRIESVNTGYVIPGATTAGVATTTAWLDMRHADPYYPILTGLRVVDSSGRQTNNLDRNGGGSVLFSVADLKSEPPFLRRVPPAEDATRVEYRIHGTSEWQPITPLITARHYENNGFTNGGVGTMYRVDLTTLTRDLTGAVDLRVLAEDAEGNRVSVQLEPAFAIGVEGRRRAVR